MISQIIKAQLNIYHSADRMFGPGSKDLTSNTNNPAYNQILPSCHILQLYTVIMMLTFIFN